MQSTMRRADTSVPERVRKIHDGRSPLFVFKRLPECIGANRSPGVRIYTDWAVPAGGIISARDPQNRRSTRMVQLQPQPADSPQLSKERFALEPEPRLVSAAQYLRASTEEQKYSTANQALVNQSYAATHGMVIARTYADEGKSGLTAERGALQRLVADVRSGDAGFDAILVYDVSRWGRYQDADEGAYYEYLCKSAGIRVHYCAEQFANDGSPFAAIVKSIKRAMAAEYSRQLSITTFAGLSNIALLGFHCGSGAVYGTRRLLLDRAGRPSRLLLPGQYKTLQSDRVVLVRGPPEEIRTVRRIFLAFVTEGKSEQAIADELNKQGIPSGGSRPWSYARVRHLLRNEIYAGNAVWNRISSKLGGRKNVNPPAEWLRAKSRLPPIVGRAEFEAAQAVFRKRRERLRKEAVLEALRRLADAHGFLDGRLIEEAPDLPCRRVLHAQFGGVGRLRELLGAKARPGAQRHFSDQELLAGLRRLRRQKGRLSRSLISGCKDLPNATTYIKRFGSLSRAYQLIGYESRRGTSLSNAEMLEALRAVLRAHGRLTGPLIEQSRHAPSLFMYRTRFGSLTRAYELIGYEGRHWTQRPRKPQ